MPDHHQNGPRRPNVHPEANITVVIYELDAARVVRAGFAFRKEKMADEDVAKILAAVRQHAVK